MVFVDFPSFERDATVTWVSSNSRPTFLPTVKKFSSFNMIWTNVLIVLLCLGKIIVADNLALLLSTLRTYQRTACEHDVVTLKCPHGTTITVQLTEYGMVSPNQKLCPAGTATPPASRNSTCLLPKAIQTVVEGCQKKRQCKFQASVKHIEADPCPGVEKYIEVGYKCRPYEFRSKVACENEVVQLKCNPHSRIAIYSASFGRTEYESVQCPQPQGVPEQTCLVSYATETVMQICHGKRSCTISADASTFGNPCRPASRMYLKVVYTCVPRKVLKERYEEPPLDDEAILAGSRDVNDYDDFDGYESIDDFFRESAAFSPPPNSDSSSVGNTTEVTSTTPRIKDQSAGKKKFSGNLRGGHTRGRGSSSSSPQHVQGDLGVETSTGNGLVNCSVTIFSSENNRVIGFISEWINVYKFMKKNQEKMYLYLILSITSGLLLVLAIVIGRLMVQKYRAVREAKFYSSQNDSTVPHGFDENSEIDADINLATTTSAIPNISSMESSTYHSSPNPAADIVQFSEIRVERDSISAPRSFSRYVSLLIVLCGPSGTGKSYLANKLAEFLVSRLGKDSTVDHKNSKELRQYLTSVADHCETNANDLPYIIILDNLHQAASLVEGFNGFLSSKYSKCPFIIGTFHAGHLLHHTPAAASQFQELNTGKGYASNEGNTPDLQELRDENMNECLHGSHYSLHSAPLSDSFLQRPPKNDNNPHASKPSLPPEKTDPKGDEALSRDPDESLEREDTFDSLVRPCSLVLPSSGEKTFNLTAIANEAQLRHCPILVKDLSCDTADDEDNENHLTISSLTARPLIAKSHELRTKKVARKLREAERRARIRRFKPPDGGYGWAVVVGAFLVQFWVSGLVKSYGVLFVEVLEAFSDTTAAFAAWIPAILSTLCLALAPIASALCQKFTCRSVVFFGGIFCAAGLISSYFATNSLHLMFSFGLLSGIGGGLSTTPGVLIVSRYFDKHRALANGICISGTAAGSFIFPILIQHLITRYGFHGTILILGGCMLHVCISAALYRPLSVHQRLVERAQGQSIHNEHLSVDITVQCPDPEQGQAIKKLEFLFINEPIEPIKNGEPNLHKSGSNPSLHPTTVDSSQNEGQILSFSDAEEDKDKIEELLQVKPIFIRSCSILHSVEDLSTDSTCVYKDKKLEKAILQSLQTAIPEIAQVQRKKTFKEHITQYLDISLLKNVKFIIMCCSVTLMSTGCPYVLYFLPAYAISSGFTKSQAGVLIVVSAVLDFVGRLGLGWISDMKLFDRKKGYVSSIFGAGITVLILPAAANYYLLTVLIGIYGLCLGSWFLLVPVLLADDYGTNKISSSYGLVRLFQSIGAISIPPLAGYMRDVTGSYDICFYFMGACMVLGGVIFLMEPIGLDCKVLNTAIPKINLPEQHNVKT